MPDRRGLLPMVAFLLAVLFAAPANAQDTPFDRRANELVELLRGVQNEEAFFSDTFRQAVPPRQFRALTQQLRDQYGEPEAIARAIPQGPLSGTVEVAYEKAVLAFRMHVSGDPPHPVVGLLVTGAAVHDDDLAQISAAFEALPGTAAFAVHRLEAGALSPVAATGADRHLAVGSVFKLYVLAALSDAIASGERGWDDVVPLGPASVPPGVTHDWAAGAPVTLHSLASLMIARSDNRATDTLTQLLGPDRIAAAVRASGHSDPEILSPMLTTRQAFALKTAAASDLRDRYVAASPVIRARLLRANAERLANAPIDLAEFGDRPAHIETVEWFATPTDMNRVLAYLAGRRDEVTYQILRINPVIAPGDAKRWRSLGGKGGSEPGVIAFAFHGRATDGTRYLVSAAWNDPARSVDERAFLALTTRLLNVLAVR